VCDAERWSRWQRAVVRTAFVGTLDQASLRDYCISRVRQRVTSAARSWDGRGLEDKRREM